MVEEFLRQRREKILDKWLDRILSTYPADSFKFLKSEKDQFRNPVGHTLWEETAVILDSLLNGAEFEVPTTSLDNIVRIRSVQDCPPSQAVAFVFLIKDVIKDELRDLPSDTTVSDELAAFQSKVDILALAAFDNYMKCKEKIYDLGAREARMRSAKLLERLSRLNGESE
jgi:hypothetical protein